MAMGTSHSVEKTTFDGIQQAVRGKGPILLSTLPKNEQRCLILSTLSPDVEEALLNKCLQRGESGKHILVYGKNALDASPEKKCKQLLGLGFTHVRMYPGGLFEWALLQEVYGTGLFPTTAKIEDPQEFSKRCIEQLLLTA